MPGLNVPALTDGQTITRNQANELTQVPDLKLINDVADARYRAGAAQAAYDAVMFDVFATGDKVDSSTGAFVSTGVDGLATLYKERIVGVFEDGDSLPSDWTFSGFRYTGITNGNLELDKDTSGNADAYSDTFNEKGDVFVDAIVKRDFSANQHCELEPVNGSQYKICTAIRFEDDGSGNNGPVYVGGVTIENPFVTDKWYSCQLVIDWTNGVIEKVIVNGTEYADGSTLTRNDYIEQFNIHYYSQSDPSIVFEGYWNNMKVAKYLESPQSLVSTSKSLSFTPAKAIIEQNATIDGAKGQDITYKLKDSNGNAVTIDQSEVGTEVDASALANGNVHVEAELSASSESPTLNEYGVYFV